MALTNVADDVEVVVFRGILKRPTHQRLKLAKFVVDLVSA
jgi:hypothetical protein